MRHGLMGAVSCLTLWCPRVRVAREMFSEFRLPNGDVDAGKAAFLELTCAACHEVKGLNLPPSVADPTVPVALGGGVNYQPTDGRFVTSIINPDHKLAPGYPEELIESGSESRMADYSEVMTVRQLVDLVAFCTRATSSCQPPCREL